MSKKQRFRIITIFLSLFGWLGLFYTNCSSNYEISKDTVTTSQATSGNGYGYGGKLSVYNRYLPEFNCENQPSALSSIEINGTDIKFFENIPHQCGANNQTLQNNDLDTSPLQSDVLSYLNGVYMNVAPNTQGIPDKLAEAWCRDDLNPNVDIITHYNRIEQKGFAKIYYKNATHQIATVPEFLSSRVISQHIIEYQTSEFSLRIDRDDLALLPGTFWGQFRYSSQGIELQKKVFCRLGGSLDPKIWPALQINSSKIVHSAYDPLTDSILYDSGFPGKGNGLYSWSQQKTEVLIEPGKLGGTFELFDFKISKTGKIIFRSTLEASANSNTLRYFSLDRNNHKITQMSLPGHAASHGPTFGTDYGFDPSGNFALFLDDALKNSFFGNTDLFLSDLETPGTLLSHNIPDNFTNSVRYFTLAKQKPRITYTFTDSGNSNDYKIAVVDINGTQRKIFDPKALGLTRTAGYNSFFGNDDYLLVTAYSSTDGVVDYGLSLNDGSLRKIRNQSGDTSSGISLSSPSARYLSYTYNHVSSQPTQSYFVRDTTTWNEVPIGLLDLQGVQKLSIDETHQIATTLSQGLYIEIDLRTGSRRTLCQLDSQKTIVDITPGPDGITRYLAQSSPLNSGGGYQVSILEAGLRGCNVKNTFPSNAEKVFLIQVSPDQNGILAAAQLPGRTYVSPVHIPLDGRPALQLNTPAIPDSGFYGAHYIDGGKSVVFYGYQLVKGANDIYMITLP